MTTLTIVGADKNCISLLGENRKYYDNYDFAAIMARAKSGHGVTSDEAYAWDLYKIDNNINTSEMDEIELAARLNGFEMNFKNGFPRELENKLNYMWKNCNSNSEKNEFINMYLSVFSEAGINGGDKSDWATDWRGKLLKTMETSKSLCSGVSKIIDENNNKTYRIIQNLLEI